MSKGNIREVDSRFSQETIEASKKLITDIKSNKIKDASKVLCGSICKKPGEDDGPWFNDLLAKEEPKAQRMIWIEESGSFQ